MQKISSIPNLFCRKIWGSDHTTRSRSCCTTRRLAEAEVEAGVLAYPRLLPSSRGWGSGKQQGRESSVRSFCWRLGICSCFSQFILLPIMLHVIILFYSPLKLFWKTTFMTWLMLIIFSKAAFITWVKYNFHQAYFFTHHLPCFSLRHRRFIVMSKSMFL